MGAREPEQVWHIAYFVGTRPEVIRSARTLRALAADPAVRLSVINSRQHYDDNMMDAFFRELHVPAAVANLEVGSAESCLQTMTTAARAAEALLALRPDCLCVFGDTNSSLGAALAAAKTGIPLVHIEAGCRSFDMAMPEETNRRLIDQIAGLLLPVSQASVDNLAAECAPGYVHRVGDPLLDVFRESFFPFAGDREGGLLTLHRAETVDDPARLDELLDQLSMASELNSLEWIFPVHPRTRRALPSDAVSGVVFVDPLPYRDLLTVLSRSRLCVTDSGGLQKEALWAKVPCITIRKSTEWIETISQGANVLCPPGGNLVVAVQRALDGSVPRDFHDPYGSEDASREVIQAVVGWLAAGAQYRVTPSRA